MRKSVLGTVECYIDPALLDEYERIRFEVNSYHDHQRMVRVPSDLLHAAMKREIKRGQRLLSELEFPSPTHTL